MKLSTHSLLHLVASIFASIKIGGGIGFSIRSTPLSVFPKRRVPKESLKEALLEKESLDTLYLLESSIREMITDLKSPLAKERECYLGSFLLLEDVESLPFESLYILIGLSLRRLATRYPMHAIV